MSFSSTARFSLLFIFGFTGVLVASPKLAKIIRVSDGKEIEPIKVFGNAPTENVRAAEKRFSTASSSSPLKVAAAPFGLDSLIVAPNPYNPATDSLKIDFVLGDAAGVEMWLYSINGQEHWHTSVAGATGYNQVTCDVGPGLASGAYVLYLKAQSGSETVIKRAKVLVRR
jgi:hypothetical protein